MNKSWTVEEKHILSDNYGEIKLSELMRLLPTRTRSAIKLRAKYYKIKGGFCKPWTIDEDEILRQYYGTWSKIERYRNMYGLSVTPTDFS